MRQLGVVLFCAGLEMNGLKRLGRKSFLALAVLGQLASQKTLNADILYATSINTSQIFKVDTVADTATPSLPRLALSTVSSSIPAAE